MRISTADLSDNNIYVKGEIEDYLRSVRPDDPHEALAHARYNPHTLAFPQPLELMTPMKTSRNRGDPVYPHLASAQPTTGSLLKVSKNVYVVCPELAILQVAPMLKDVHLVAALITELCGNYVLLPSGLISCDRYVRQGRAPFEGTRLLGDGYVDCVSVTSVDAIRKCLRKHPHAPGSVLVAKALEASNDGSASPLETYQGVELQLKRTQGGRGAGIARRNAEVSFNDVERDLAGGNRKKARADLLFTAKSGKRIDVEPGGVFGHAGKAQMDADQRRRQALEHAGMEVITLTSDQYRDIQSWDAICRRIVNHLGKRHHPPTDRIRARQLLVHTDFCNWDCLRVFPPSAWRRSPFDKRSMAMR